MNLIAICLSNSLPGLKKNGEYPVISLGNNLVYISLPGGAIRSYSREEFYFNTV